MQKNALERAAERDERIWSDLPKGSLSARGVVPLLLGLVFVPVIGMYVALLIWGG